MVVLDTNRCAAGIEVRRFRSSEVFALWRLEARQVASSSKRSFDLDQLPLVFEVGETETTGEASPCRKPEPS